MKDLIIEKLTSRKLWVAICGFVALIIIAVTGDESTATQVTAIIMAGATVIAYIVGEGLVDAVDASTDEDEEGEE